MKKFIYALSFVMMTAIANGQLVVILQSPPSGFVYKPQLWTMVLSNTVSQPLQLHIEVTLNSVGSGQQVMSAVTRTFTLIPGTTQIGNGHLVPIQYNVTGTAFNIDPNPMGLLPLGEFEACFHFFKHAGDVVEEIAEQCADITISPLSPPQLVYPYDATAIEEANPQLAWLPPLPVQLFANLNYDLTLVEINSGQSPADAISQNMPLYQAVNLSASAVLYPLSAPALLLDHHYAWRVAAKSNGSVAGISETWQFTRKQFGSIPQSQTASLPFVQLKKSPENAYAIFAGDIKFSYVNETPDSNWHITLTDIGNTADAGYSLPLDTTPLRRGQNLVTYKATEDSYFVDGHIYQMEIRNSRNEMWRMRFEYKQPTISNN